MAFVFGWDLKGGGAQALSFDQQMLRARIGLCAGPHVREIELSSADWAYGKANQACAAALLQGPASAPMASFAVDTSKELEPSPTAAPTFDSPSAGISLTFIRSKSILRGGDAEARALQWKRTRRGR